MSNLINITTIFSRLKLSFLLPLMVLVVAPFSFYFANVNSIHFSIDEIIIPLIMLIFSISGIIFIFLSFLSKSKPIFRLVEVLIVGLSISAWVQSQLLVWNFGFLDGGAIDWGNWIVNIKIEWIVWFLVIGLIFLGTFFSKKIHFIQVIINSIIALSVFSIGVNYLTAEQRLESLIYQDNELNKAFMFHPQNNIFIILLDGFQSDYFDYIRENYSQEIDFLDGFIFYRNTISKFPTTIASKPAIVMNAVYKNEEPIYEFNRKAYDQFSFQKLCKQRNYSYHSFGTPIPNTKDGVSFDYILKNFNWIDVKPIYKFIDYGLFRVLPTSLKKYVYNNGDWFFSFQKLNHYPPDWHGNDIRFLELFEREAFINANNGSGSFKLFHFFLPHLPLRVNETLQYDPNLSGPDGYIKQCRGALKVASRVINVLKKFELYDKTEIFIISDHGTKDFPSIQFLQNDSARLSLFHVPMKVQTSALSLFLHKKPYKAGKLTVNDLPLELSDLKCFLFENINKPYCDYLKSILAEGHRQRVFFFYDWTHDYWDWTGTYLPPITEFIVSGHSYDRTSWRFGDYTYKSTGKIPTEAPSYQYTLGKKLNVTDEGEAEAFLTFGWSVQEKNHRWTDGPVAGMLFLLQEIPCNDLILRISGSGFYPERLDKQMVKVFVNGKPLADWELEKKWMAGTYEAIIPLSLIPTNRLIEIAFEISDPGGEPVSSQAQSSRKLGMAVRSITIDNIYGHSND